MVLKLLVNVITKSRKFRYIKVASVLEFTIVVIHCISSELSWKVHVSKESLILRLGGQVSSIFKLKWVGEVKLCRKNAFHDCSIA